MMIDENIIEEIYVDFIKELKFQEERKKTVRIDQTSFLISSFEAIVGRHHPELIHRLKKIKEKRSSG